MFWMVGVQDTLKSTADGRTESIGSVHGRVASSGYQVEWLVVHLFVKYLDIGSGWKCGLDCWWTGLEPSQSALTLELASVA